MTKKDYLTHIIKNIIHTTNVKNKLEINNEKDNRVGAFNTVSQIASKSIIQLPKKILKFYFNGYWYHNKI